MDKTEKNKILAEWAGFTFEGCWWNPTRDRFGRGHWRWDLPDFLNDLNALFKWVVPKLEKGHIIQFCAVTEGWVCMIDDTIYESGETPALALCEAILKLLGKEV